MDIRDLTDRDLLKLAKDKSKEEQANTLTVIRIVREVDRRRLYLELGFGSLHQYVIQELNYDEGSADRRIAAARLTNEIPELEQKLSDGKLTLTNLAQARTFFRREEKLNSEKLTKEQKWDVLTQLEGQSTREAAKTLLTLSPGQVAFHESQRPIAENLEEWKLIVPSPLKAKIERLKSLLSHRLPGATHVELIDAIADIALEKLDRNRSEKRETAASVPPPAPEVPGVTKEGEARAGNSRYVPVGIKATIRERAEDRCEYVDESTGRRCENRHRLQIHHEVPFGKGGLATSENLKLYCQPHNGFEAVRDYGQYKMQFFLPHLRQ